MKCAVAGVDMSYTKSPRTETPILHLEIKQKKKPKVDYSSKADSFDFRDFLVDKNTVLI
jgi:hypothetical protein